MAITSTCERISDDIETHICESNIHAFWPKAFAFERFVEPIVKTASQLDRRLGNLKRHWQDGCPGAGKRLAPALLWLYQNIQTDRACQLHTTQTVLDFKWKSASK